MREEGFTASLVPACRGFPATVQLLLVRLSSRCWGRGSACSVAQLHSASQRPPLPAPTTPDEHSDLCNGTAAVRRAAKSRVRAFTESGGASAEFRRRNKSCRKAFCPSHQRCIQKASLEFRLSLLSPVQRGTAESFSCGAWHRSRKL